MISRYDLYSCYPLPETAEAFRYIDMYRMEQLPVFSVPVYLSARVWNRCIRVPKWAVPETSEKRHLWDLLVFLLVCVQDPCFLGPEKPFDYRIRNLEPFGPEERVRRKAVVYVDDDGERRLVVMFAAEASWQPEERVVLGRRLLAFE
ncbi:MAG: hypothetical protein U0804_01425 [Gemmataceae bacterium]